MFGGMPAKKAEHFWPSAKRLMGLLKPEALGIYAVVGLVVVSVVLNVIAPKILGQAMDVIFAGVVGKQLPAGVSKDQFVAGLRQQGQDNFADMVSRMELVPGTGINFDKLTMLIAVVLVMYFVANIFMWLQGYVLNRIVMKVIRRLRDDTEEQAEPASAELLRHPAARRRAVPGDQRRRQHPAGPPAGLRPAGQLCS